MTAGAGCSRGPISWEWRRSRTASKRAYAHLEGLPFRRARLLKPLLRPLFRAVVGSDVRAIARIVEDGGS